MRILITGGFGFIGGRIADCLARAGHQVLLGARNETNPPVWLPQAAVTKIQWDDEKSIQRCCEGVDIIVHAAGMNAHDCAADPKGAYDFNGLATKRLVEAGVLTGVKKFIYLSTAHVYASPLTGTITEKTLPTNSHPYALSNLAGESAVVNANQRGVIQGVVLRVSNAYGEPMHKDVNCWMLVVHDLCRQLSQTRRLVLKTSGLQERDFVCMTQVCRVLEFLILTDRSDKIPCVINVGDGMSQTVLEMAYFIQRRCSVVLGFQPSLIYVKDSLSEHSTGLAYKSDYLQSSVFQGAGSDKIIEIDRLIKFCQRAFS